MSYKVLRGEARAPFRHLYLLTYCIVVPSRILLKKVSYEIKLTTHNFFNKLISVLMSFLIINKPFDVVWLRVTSLHY